MRVAVVAHAGKTVGGGLPELRRVLATAGVEDPFWVEVPKAKRAPDEIRRALDEGADVVFAWGGDGLVRRCAGALAGTAVRLALVPAGTANHLALNLGIPADIADAVAIGLGGSTRTIDIGRFNDERFAVMAGAGFDASMMRDADALKARLGRLAYVYSGSRNLPPHGFGAEIEVDGVEWYEGRATCVLAGNVGRLFGGLEPFPDARPDDGSLEFGVVTAEGLVKWLRTVARAAVGRADRSPFVHTTRGRRIEVRLDRKVRYELDGGDRSEVQSFRVAVETRVLQVCVPATAGGGRAA